MDLSFGVLIRTIGTGAAAAASPLVVTGDEASARCGHHKKGRSWLPVVGAVMSMQILGIPQHCTHAEPVHACMQTSGPPSLSLPLHTPGSG